MIGFALGALAGVAFTYSVSLALYFRPGGLRDKARAQAEQAQRDFLSALEARAEAEGVAMDLCRQTIKAGRAVYSIEFLRSFPTFRGHFRMCGPTPLPGGLMTAEVKTTTPLVRGAAAHLAEARRVLAHEAETRAEAVAVHLEAGELVGKALALLDMADAELAAKELVDGVRP